MEGKVYICTWKKVGTKYQVWLKKNPKIKASARTFEEADEILAGEIMEIAGDGENVREYLPPAPESSKPAKLLDIAIVHVGGNTHSRIVGEDKHLFSGGVCPHCGTFLGERTAAPLVIDGVASGYDGGFVWQKPFQYFSADFLKLLTPKERASFEWRPIELQRRSRKTFFEMIPRETVPHVAVRGMPFEPLHCPKCQTIIGLHLFQKGTSIYTYVNRDSLPKRLPTCFAVGEAHNFKLAFIRDRWLELAGRPGARGLVSNKVGVIAAADCDPKPKFRRHPGR
ncbi:MAG: hypothetical protein K0Q55_3731 [Verrucomicrobia bacterium]|jgi:hypothetical protein|nr:hypothetical protein [Verrucomicrobiota bacterium]